MAALVGSHRGLPCVAHGAAPARRPRPAAGRRARPEARGKAAGVEAMTGAELEVALESRDRVLLVDFFATWCGPCVMLQNELETVAETLGDAVRIVKVDTDEEPELSSSLGIAGLPTLLFVYPDNSKPALRTEGLLSSAQILRILETEMGVPNPLSAGDDAPTAA